LVSWIRRTVSLEIDSSREIRLRRSEPVEQDVVRELRAQIRQPPAPRCQAADQRRTSTARQLLLEHSDFRLAPHACLLPTLERKTNGACGDRQVSGSSVRV
jgi:hypothetical protein